MDIFLWMTFCCLISWNDIIHVTDFNHEKLQLTKSLEYPDPVFSIQQGRDILPGFVKVVY